MSQVYYPDPVPSNPPDGGESGFPSSEPKPPLWVREFVFPRNLSPPSQGDVNPSPGGSRRRSIRVRLPRGKSQTHGSLRGGRAIPGH